MPFWQNKMTVYFSFDLAEDTLNTKIWYKAMKNIII